MRSRSLYCKPLQFWRWGAVFWLSKSEIDLPLAIDRAMASVPIFYLGGLLKKRGC